MFTPSEDELHRRSMRSTLLSQHELALSIAFYATGRYTRVPEGVKPRIHMYEAERDPDKPWGEKYKTEAEVRFPGRIADKLKQEGKYINQPMRITICKNDGSEEVVKHWSVIARTWNVEEETGILTILGVDLLQAMDSPEEPYKPAV